MTVFMLNKTLFFKLAMRKLQFGNSAPISEEFAGAEISALFLFSLISARVFHVRAKLVRSGLGNDFASAECDRQSARGRSNGFPQQDGFLSSDELTEAVLRRPSMANL